jgi:hypothetical protein
MDADVVSAEVTPRAGKGREAALRLQERGFHIRHVGATSISVEGPPGLWERTFRVGFRRVRQPRAKQLPASKATFHEPTGQPAIPAELADLVEDVAFVRPPELY